MIMPIADIPTLCLVACNNICTPLSFLEQQYMVNKAFG
jgi:hypothetical protein